jgi:hypothetical protein
MNRRNLLLLLLSGLLTVNTTFAGGVQFASTLIDYSSAVGNRQFGPGQVLGPPDAMPQGGKSPCAWMSKQANAAREFLYVGFDSLMSVRQIAVFENLQPGSVVGVFLIGEDGKSERIFKGVAAPTTESSRVFPCVPEG